ncbi:fimbria/pilus outer membrane usher protein [Escherichia coli]|uniref:fimbria/pilus outer membrane usher protein n=1 Tax=Escherichia coli TaxID=562 RepID=UPI00207B78D5|nr:fimbria/pilus outer membrane usher protein [Escherichia coli]
MVILGIIPPPLIAADEAEFDSSFLQHIPGKNVIDIRRFIHGNPVPAGQYYSDIYLNGEWKGRTNIRFADTKEHGGAMLCLTPQLISMIDLISDAIKVSPTEEGCTTASPGFPVTRTHFDLSTLRLDIEVPQAFLTPRPRGYISPDSWQTGVPAAFIGYDVNHYQYQGNYAKNSQTWLGVRAGFNLEGWALRHRGSENWNNGSAEGYHGIETNIQHDVPTLRSQLTFGDFTTSGDIMDSISLRGGRLASDDRMLPGSLRGYAPVVRGVAASNARITIRQNGNVIYETTVPAGPFTISDLYPSGYSGDLTVTVTEASGATRTFSVPFASVAQLVRPGYSRWQISAGQYRYGNKTLSDTVFQGTLQYGLTNDVTLNTGLTTAPHYTAGLAGVAYNTPAGAVASDITLSKTKFTASDSTRQGYSLHTSYSVSIPATNTNLTLAAYRYSSKDFYNLKDAIWANHSDFIDDISIKSAAFYRPRNQFQLSLNQELGKIWGNLWITGATYNYWGHTGHRNEYQLGYSNKWKQLSYQFGFSQSRDNENRRHDDRVYLNFSLPLWSDTGSPLLSSTLNFNKGKYSDTQTSLSGVLGEDNQFSYGVAATSQRHGSSGYSLNGGYRTPFVNLMATTTYDSEHNHQLSLEASGAIVAHPYGVTLSNDLSDTFTIIHAKGADGAIINNAPGNRLDWWGNGIVPYVTPYEINRVSIDPTNLPVNVELDATEQEIIPKANSATLVTFSTQAGNTMLFNIKLPGGDIPPMAAEAFNEQGQSVGYVTQGGRLFARGVTDKGRIDVLWGRSQNKRCSFNYQFKNREKNMTSTLPFHNVLCRQGK